MDDHVAPDLNETLGAFVTYAQNLKGYEKGEAQLYCERLFQAFGHAGLAEIGAELEYGIKKRRGKGTKFADLRWGSVVLIEMKSRGERLERHVAQARDYWIELVPDRPAYVILCNFDEFWIYDFNVQLEQPVDVVKLEDLPARYNALAFLQLVPQRPLFANDRVAVTREAADKLAAVFGSLIARGESREHAQRFVLQCIVSLFAEDFDLLPKDFFGYLLRDCAEGESSFDLIGGLFRQMAEPNPARGGRFEKVRYFNGGLFSTVYPIELTDTEVALLREASAENWTAVAPPIFGTIFQGSMDTASRHAQGAHFTHEVDIQKIVLPTIVRPWRERIDAATKLAELEALLAELHAFRVLDPACGSGNFLYVAYREVVTLHLEILQRIEEEFGAAAGRRARARRLNLPPLTNFLGIDLDSFAVALAKVTLMVAKRIVLADVLESRFGASATLELEFEQPLPLDNLDATIVEADALLTDWPACDAIIGNPPFISKNKAQEELGAAYLARVRAAHPGVPGRADLCVYWFRIAHDHLSDGQRAGLVGTNTIRQNYSREGGLDHIVATDGEIVEAVSSQVWSGDAAVHVSIVNWVQGAAPPVRVVLSQIGDRLDSPWERVETDRIAPTLSPGVDVSGAATLRCNAASNTTRQGQTHGHKGFLLTPVERDDLVSRDAATAAVVHPFMTAEDLLGRAPASASRHVIDFGELDVIGASQYREAFARLKREVLPVREAAAKKEEVRNAEVLAASPTARVNSHHRNFLRGWWRMSYPRAELIARLNTMKRYIVCGQVTKRPVFAFVSTDTRPNAALQVFTFDDDYSFGILQSSAHWTWFVERCSTFESRFRYTSNTVYDSFAWPQTPSSTAVLAVASTSRKLQTLRRSMLKKHGLSLRELYRLLELPGANPLKQAHAALDAAVVKAYGFDTSKSLLEHLFALNADVAAREKEGRTIQAPGVPRGFDAPEKLVSAECFGGT